MDTEPRDERVPAEPEARARRHGAGGDDTRRNGPKANNDYLGTDFVNVPSGVTRTAIRISPTPSTY